MKYLHIFRYLDDCNKQLLEILKGDVLECGGTNQWLLSGFEILVISLVCLEKV